MGSNELDKSIEKAKRARDMLMSNKIEEARAIVSDDYKTDMYSAMAYCNIGFMQAIMTFDRDRIAQSIVDIDAGLQLISSCRHKDGMLSYLISYVKNRDFTKFTELEKHAELLYAELLLLRAVMTFAEEPDSLVSFVKGAFKIKACHSLFKELYTSLSYEEAANANTVIESAPPSFTPELAGGVKGGWGAFLLGLSLLPPKVLRLLEFVGLQGEKSLGLGLIIEAEKMDVLRSFVMAVGLLNYELIVLQMIKSDDYDDALVEEMLVRYLNKYPDSVQFTFFRGRQCVINGEISSALDHYKACENTPVDWVQVYHLCYWERMWCYALLLQWGEAAQLAHKLFDESKWSRTLFGYQHLSFLFMADTEAPGLEEMARKIPKYQLRIGGKHLHIEKFAIRKARSFLANDGFLCLPGVELLYIWRFIPLMGRTEKEQLIELLESTIEEIGQVVPYYSEHPLEDWFLCHLLLAVVTAEMGDTEHALSLLRTALQSGDSIQVDHFYIPYAHFELGQLYATQGEIQQARAHFRYAKEFSDKVKSYSLENRLLFRIHSAMSALPA